MGETPESPSPGISNAFLRRYLEDREAGTPRSLEEYQREFPGYEALIAHEFHRLEAAGPAESAGPPPALSAAPGLPAERVGPYKLLQVLGEGGMGIVYLAEQTEPIRRRVALKLIKLGMDTREVLARFESERQALAVMSHTHIARVFDAGTSADGRPYFVMEHVAGLPITRFADERGLRTAERLELFLQVCEAVQHAHHKGIIHRDLKPSNVLVTLDGDRPVVKVIDFGIARSLSRPLTERTYFTEHGQLIGTPEYMSPEQAGMGGLDVDARTDLYSLGVVLYELLAGVPPFDPQALRAAGLAEIQRRIREEHPPRPSTRLSTLGKDSDAIARRHGAALRALLRELEGDLDWITMKAMEKERARRYASASELAADIRRHLAQEPVLARPPELSYRLRKFFERHRVGVRAGAVIVLLSLAAAALAWHAARSAEREARIARTERLLDEARVLRGAYAGSLSRLEKTKEAHRELQAGTRPWLPVWHPECRSVLEKGRELEAIRREAARTFSAGLGALFGALEEAPAESRLRDGVEAEIAALYHERYREGLGAGDRFIDADFFLPDEMDAGPSVLSTLEVSSRPAGAEVYCFRYIDHEFRLAPAPFDPREDGGVPDAELEERLFLEVETVTRPALIETRFPSAARFEPGDRFLSVAGRPVRSRTELARALEGTGEGVPVTVTIARGGRTVEVVWVPFPPEARDAPDENGLTENPFVWRDEWNPGALYSIPQQFGFTFRGYPLAFEVSNRLGRTPLRVELEPGSYLLVLRLEGRVEARVPVLVPAGRGALPPIAVELPREVPAGFVYVPRGTFRHGGIDRELHQNLEPGSTELAAFAIARHEVTFGEYLEFLNDPEVFAATDETGRTEPRADWTQAWLRKVLPPDASTVAIVPVDDDRNLLFTRDAQAARWSPGAAVRSLSRPVLGVSMLAGLEYAAWRTRKDPRWTYRLPDDIEWEKAARGADGRIYVWGNDPVWSYCRSAKSNQRKLNTPGPVGAFPLDESVFGVRDMAGSVYEPTRGATVPGYRFCSRRGGHWRTVDDFFFRVATRNGRVPEGTGTDCGLRLVAEMR